MTQDKGLLATTGSLKAEIISKSKHQNRNSSQACICSLHCHQHDIDLVSPYNQLRGDVVGVDSMSELKEPRPDHRLPACRKPFGCHPDPQVQSCELLQYNDIINTHNTDLNL